jgi:energy-coupling factor transporter ATP-binding protein EcfA2
MTFGAQALGPQNDRPWGLRKYTRYFASYEAREAAFARQIAALVPPKHAGPQVFWRDFGRIRGADLSTRADSRHLAIGSNPRECLAFGTPRQVLRAAHLQLGSGRDRGDAPDIEATARQFDILDTLDQPLRTLSGGETLKLCCAKVFMAARQATGLTIASPFCWLSHESTGLLTDLVNHCQERAIPVALLALEGEDSRGAVEPAALPKALRPVRLPFELQLAGVRISLGTVLNTLKDRPAVAGVDDFSARLDSPCLLVGANGQGKSLVARVLARAVACRGTASLDRGRGPESARLLFQDVLNQTLLRPFPVLAAADGQPARTLTLFGRIGQLCQRYCTARGVALPAGAFQGQAPFRSLLETKALLAAARLGRTPGALILDEPDWGLTRETAIALVAAITRVAHDHGTPIVLISHKPWWPPFCASVVAVSRSRHSPPGRSAEAFRVSLALSAQTGAHP